MSPLILLRIAAAIGFLFCAGHTLGAPWTPGGDAALSAAVASMKAAVIPDLEPARTYWDFYFGFGLSVSIYLLALAVVLWQTASLARSAFDRARPVMTTLFACYLAVAVIAARYFFLVPAAMAAAICLCIALAWWRGRGKNHVAQPISPT